MWDVTKNAEIFSPIKKLCKARMDDSVLYLNKWKNIFYTTRSIRMNKRETMQIIRSHQSVYRSEHNILIFKNKNERRIENGICVIVKFIFVKNQELKGKKN